MKDGLVSRVKDTPFFSTYMHQSQGKPLRFWYIDWAAFWKAGGPDNKKHRAKDYMAASTPLFCIKSAHKTYQKTAAANKNLVVS